MSSKTKNPIPSDINCHRRVTSGESTLHSSTRPEPLAAFLRELESRPLVSLEEAAARVEVIAAKYRPYNTVFEEIQQNNRDQHPMDLADASEAMDRLIVHLSNRISHLSSKF